MRYRNTIGILSLLLLAAVLAGPSLSGYAIDGRYVEVDIEVFHGWGFLGLGTWNELEPRLVSLRIEPLPGDESARVGPDYAFYRDYSVVPSLGDPYRVVLTNRTDGLLGIVLAIDGLNTNGDAAVTGTDADRKWILLPHQTVRIVGWRVGTDRALRFSFATPSGSHSPEPSARGMIRVYAYLPASDGFEKGTGAGELIEQPTVLIPFRSATRSPLEVITIGYGRGRVGLGFTCMESEGAGILVGEVIPGTIADLRGLRPGDVITYANASPLSSCSDLRAVLAAKSPGDRVVVKVHREGRAFLLMLEIEE